MKNTFKIQLITTIFLIVIGFVLSLRFDKDIFYNIAWAVVGFIFVVNPVYPEKLVLTEGDKAKIGIRIAGFVLIFIGLTNGFGV